MIIDLSLEIQSFETIDQGDHAIFPLDKAKGREGSIVIQNEGALEENNSPEFSFLRRIRYF